MRHNAFFNTILDRLPNVSITATPVSTKGEVCPKLDNVLKLSK